MFRCSLIWGLSGFSGRCADSTLQVIRAGTVRFGRKSTLFLPVRTHLTA